MHFDGNGATLSWTTTDATGVSLFIDGGLFSSYGPSGSATLPFACTATPGTTQSHTYALLTKGTTELRRIVGASALVNVITDVGSGGAPMGGASASPSASASP